MLGALYRAAARVRAVFRSGDLDLDFDAELEAHAELLAEEHVRRGASPEEARRLARLDLGGAAELREAHRDARGVPALGALAQDLRYAVRALRHDLGFTAFTSLILALGVGASVTVFAVVNALLLRPLPLADSGRLVWIANRGDDGVSEWNVQATYFVELRGRNTSFADVAAYNASFGPNNAKLARDGEAERLSALRVTESFFSLFDVKPELGRTFTAEECAWNGPRAVVLGDELWRRRFGADPGVVGTVVTIDDAPATVVGVAPPFDFGDVFYPGTRVDVYLAAPVSPEANRFGNTLALVGRLKPGATVDGARAEVDAIADRLEAERPELNGFSPIVMPLAEHVTGRLRPALLVLSWSVVVLMLIVWANVGSLQMARALARRKETAVRAAIGAGRWRLVRQSLTESTVLAVLGATAGVALAAAGTRLLAGLNVFDLPLLASVRVDAAALGFAAALALLTGLVFGVAPAVQSLSLPVNDALKDAGRGTTGSRRHARVRGVLVASEIALACVLLVGAGLLVRSLVNVLSVDLGFRPEQTVMLRVDPAGKDDTLDRRGAYFDDVLARTRAIPGVTGAAVADVLPFVGDRGWQVSTPGLVRPPGTYPQSFVRTVSDGYLETMGVAVVEGRGFTAEDTPGSEPVALVNESLARTLWPGLDAVGRTVLGEGVQGPGRRVVGVVADVRHRGFERDSGGELYFPIRQTKNYGSVNLVVRSARDLRDLAPSIRAALAPIAPELARADVRTVQAFVDRSVAPRRFVVWLLAGFSVFALLLAALGVYAVISYSVGQRTHEVGIRMALGARPGDVIRLVVGQGAALAAVGLLVGLVAALGLSRVLESMLFGVTTTDPLAYVAGVGLLALVALAACFAPARRASRVDPLVALRHD